MKKLMVLLVIFAFGITAPAFAAKAVLSDSEMGNINAGEWSKKDVVTENTLEIKDVAQQYFVGVNNGNAVDSGIAMSTNVASATDAPLLNVNQTNTATITNNRPKNVSSAISKESETLSISSTKIVTDTAILNGDLNANDSEEASLFGLVGGEKSSVVATLDASNDFDLSDTCTVTKTDNEDSTENDSSAQAEENTLTLKDSSQTNITAVGNLNAVASGAAMQCNVATTNAMTGSLTQINTATVVSGL